MNSTDNEPIIARPDIHRDRRKGVPEIILAERKTLEATIQIARHFLDTTHRALLSRVPETWLDPLRQAFPDAEIEWHPNPRAMAIRHPDGYPTPTGGRVGICTAGTSDIPAAEEAAFICREMGCTVYPVYDVGVAGIHRLFDPLEHLIREARVDVIIVAAGMDGALPSVVAGLVDVPVIGLPTSVGYGLGGQGQAALLAMLQTCAPGLAVVNIDNGIGAGAIAGLIANRAAAARNLTQEDTQ